MGVRVCIFGVKEGNDAEVDGAGVIGSVDVEFCFGRKERKVKRKGAKRKKKRYTPTDRQTDGHKEQFTPHT